MSNYLSEIEAGNERLFKLHLADISMSEIIGQYLQSNEKLQVIVTSVGDCFIVPDPLQRRMVAHLLVVVREIIGCVSKVYISPIALAQWREKHQAEAAHPQIRPNETNLKLSYVLERAIDMHASDIYLDIGRKSATLSFKIWGYKRLIDRFSSDQGFGLARSMWALADTGHFEELAPCDCAFSFAYGDHGYRIRCNSLPDIRGPSLVCRIRDPAFTLPLHECGYSADQVRLIGRLCALPGGLILVTGETNSGKSTTLASLMRQLPNTQKIIEIADPVEVQMDHVTHVELNRYHQNAEEIYARIQAAIVRQNPDTLVLGEIRDAATASAVVAMAMQGKRVYSTLHAQSCLTAIPRLESIGIARDLLSLREFVVGIINQNLVPLVCQNCALSEHSIPEQQARYSRLFGSEVKHRNLEGCSLCDAGVIGCTLVAEIYPLGLDRTGKPHELIYKHNFVELENYMQRQWHVQEKHVHAASKIAAGLIDPTETERIIGEFVNTPCQPEAAAMQNTEQSYPCV